MTARIDENLVSVLSVKDKAQAVVKLRSPLEFASLRQSLKVVRYYPFISSIGVECVRDDLIKLSRSHSVEFVSASMHVSALGDTPLNPFDEAYLSENGSVHTMKAEGLTGAGVGLAVIDTGVGTHLDLCVPKNRIYGFYDVINGEENPYDDNGHGTFVTGVAVGNGLCSGKTCKGIAPESGVVAIKAISANGDSSTFKILDGMQWLYDNFHRLGIKVVCMSFGAEPTDTADPLKIGAEMLVRRGLTVVCAVGNNGENNLKSPAVSGEVISVGAVDDDGVPAKFSSYGTYHGISRPDVYAKGVRLKGLDVGGTYSYMSGTSVSAPAVAGLCCLLHQKYKNLSPRQAKGLVMSLAKEKDGIKVLDL